MRITLALAALLLAPFAAQAAEEIELPKVDFSFDGPFGSFDRASAQRGFQVYREVCSGCHSMRLISYRDLGGIGLSPQQINDVAASVSVPTTNDDGQPAERPGTPADRFKSPYPNEKAARAANNGALPPDQSVIEKAREGHAPYIYSLMIGYEEPPATMKMNPGMYYNKYFPGHQIAMPQPLRDGQVTYADGTKATVEQMGKDVATFLTYTANPEMEVRKQMGVKVVLFLVLMTGLTYAVKRKVWSDVH